MVSLDWIPDQNYTIDLSITPDGAITVSNSRNPQAFVGTSKTNSVT